MKARSAATLVLLGIAQSRANAQSISHWQTEARVEAMFARTSAVQGVVGVNTIAGAYTRLALLAGAGARRSGGDWRASGQVTAVARFHLDPFAEFAHGLYAGAGGTVLFDDGVRARTRAVVILGIDGRATARKWVTGAEVGLGGGLRLAVTLKRARASGR